MEIDVNYAVVFGGVILSLIVGSIWYGPLFGKKWMEICGITSRTKEDQKKMQQEALPLYGIQAAITFVQLYVLAHFIQAWEDQTGIERALMLWIGCVVPTIAGSVMWNNNPTSLKRASFLIQAGYHGVMFVIYGLMLGLWQ